jgi:hypothetical protein
LNKERAIVSRVKTIRGTIMALSPKYHWEQMKTIRTKNDPTMAPMTSAELQGFVVPPHWRKRRKHISEQVTSTTPIRSMFMIFSGRGAGLGFAAAGVLKKSKRARSDMPPTGRFM